MTAALIAGFIVLNAVILIVTYVTLLERKFAARMQSRIGPYRVGPHGLLQPIADAVKLMMKEDVVPTAADRGVYNLAPIVFLIPCMLIFATIPFAPGLGVADLNIGILFFLAFSSMEIVGLFMAGWGSNNKYALLSAMRAVNQIVSYDLPFIFSALVPVMLAGSLKLSDIAAAQSGGSWFVFYPVIGQLAFNLLAWFKRLVLPPAYHQATIKTIRHHLLNLAGKIVHTARRCFLMLSASSLVMP